MKSITKFARRFFYYLPLTAYLIFFVVEAVVKHVPRAVGHAVYPIFMLVAYPVAFKYGVGATWLDAISAYLVGGGLIFGCIMSWNRDVINDDTITRDEAKAKLNFKTAPTLVCLLVLTRIFAVGGLNVLDGEFAGYFPTKPDWSDVWFIVANLWLYYTVTMRFLEIILDEARSSKNTEAAKDAAP